jgi:Flp pilus assembly protein TadG
LLLPVLFLLIINVVNFGGMLFAWICVSNGARTGVQYYTTGSVTLGAPAIPGVAAVRTLVLNDLQHLPNTASTQVCVSRSDSVTVTCNSGSAPAGAPPSVDTGEGSPAIVYDRGQVDVTYTYQPFIPLWSFPALGVRATLPPTRIHRRALMRLLQ